MADPIEAGEPDRLEFLIAFEEAFSDGRHGVGDWLQRWPDEDSRVDIARVLLESAAERTRYDLAWLLEQSRDVRIPESVWRSGHLLRSVYADQVAKRHRPKWSDYAPFGTPAEELLLRAERDRCYLGQVVADRYRLVRRLGGGGIGTVYEAVGEDVDGSVAIKVPICCAADEACNDALRKEAGLARTLRLPGVPRFLELLETDAGPMMVTELVHGLPLEDLGRVDPDLALRIVAQVAETLDELHRRGHIHGDIKPDNILVDGDGDGTTKLIDFNVSRPDNPLVAADGFPGGTLPFMSPEAIVGVGADVDLRQDIYALGSLLYQLVTGEPLMSPESREEAVVMSVLIGGAYEPKFPDGVSESVQRICLAAIARQPLSRFETAGDFAAACRAVALGKDQELVIPPPQRDLHAWRLGAALGAVAVRQRRITTVLGDDPDPGVEKVQKLGPYLAGVTAAIDEVVPLAARLGLTIEAWDGADSYQTFIYRTNKLQPEDVDELMRLSVEAERWVKDVLETVQEELTARFPGSAALYCTAVQSRFSPYSSQAASRWPEVSAPASLPASVVNPFTKACTNGSRSVNWGEELKRLDYSVVRWLRWGEYE